MITKTGLVVRNLWFFRKPWLALLAGVTVSTAVLTGALIVGDSVRFSLEQLTEIRLGKTHAILDAGNRLFRQELAAELAIRTGTTMAPVLQSHGIAINNDQNLRINQVQVVGIDRQFLKLWAHPPSLPGENQAIISLNTANRLHLKVGDEFLLRMVKISSVSPNSPFVSERTPSVPMRLKVSAIANDREMGRFSTKNNQVPPYNIFLPLTTMARKNEVAGYANLLLATSNTGSGPETPSINNALQQCRDLRDAGIILKKSKQNDKIEITSDRIFLSDPIAEAVKSTLPNCEQIFTYLANSISFNQRSTPYSFITAGNSAFLHESLNDREILVNSWMADDLGIHVGDSVDLRYFSMTRQGTLLEKKSRFAVKSIVAMDDRRCDPGLMPRFPGMTDAGNCRDWQTGAPVDLKKIREKDEQYWAKYKGTPKGFISIGAGRKIWNNAFGTTTAFRFIPGSTNLPEIERSILQKISLAQMGMVFIPVTPVDTSGATGSTDFGSLFLSLSFFIIFSAILLTILLFSLHVHARSVESGILTTLGFSKNKILGILFSEVVAVVIAGGFLGALAGIPYNKLLILGLNTLWQQAIQGTMLMVDIKTSTLITGGLTGIVLSMIAMLSTILRVLKKPVLVRVRETILSPGTTLRRKKWTAFSFFILIFFSLCLILLPVVFPKTENVFSGMISGFLILCGGLFLLQYLFLINQQHPAKDRSGILFMMLKNMGIFRRRTLSVVALLAIGTFTLVITGANQKSPDPGSKSSRNGTGGFLFWAETTTPLHPDLNSPEGNRQFNLREEPLFNSLSFIPIRQLEGDDASCLNLNRVNRPVIIGVPVDLMDRKEAFSFIKLAPGADPLHPWKMLNHPTGPLTIPAFADQTVITWSLGKKIGDTLFYWTESGDSLNVVLAGGLDNSIFQGSLLVSDSLLGLFFPSSVKSKLNLIAGSGENQEEIANRLEYLFQDWGMVVTPAIARLAAFNSVENTYLSVFMLLGGLGMIIGTLGLGILLWRNILERNFELALYQALGFTRKMVMKQLLGEYLLILISGIGLGIIAGLPVVIPLLIKPGGQFPYLSILALTGTILISGFLCIYAAVKNALKADFFQLLKGEN